MPPAPSTDFSLLQGWGGAGFKYWVFVENDVYKGEFTRKCSVRKQGLEKVGKKTKHQHGVKSQKKIAEVNYKLLKKRCTKHHQRRYTKHLQAAGFY